MNSVATGLLPGTLLLQARAGWQRIDAQVKQLFKQGLVDQQQADPARLDRFFGRAAA